MIAPDDILDRLGSQDAEVQLFALKQLKNSLIGHDEEKLCHLNNGTIPMLLDIMANGAGPNRTEAGIIIGSFAYGNPIVVQTLLNYPVVPTVLGVISPSAPLSLLSSALRTLVTIISTKPVPSIISQNVQIVSTIDYLLSNPSTPPNILDQCCRLLPLISPSKVSLSYLTPLNESLTARIGMLMRQYQQTRMKVLPLVSSLFALAHILSPSHAQSLLSSSSSQPGASGTVKSSVSSESFLQGLTLLIRSEQPEIRLAAVTVFTKLQRYATNPAQQKLLTQPLPPTLVPLLTILPQDPRVCRTLAVICRDDEDIARMAVEAGVIQKLADTLKTADYVTWKNSELIADTLLAIAGIVLHANAYRTLAIENGILTHVINIISSKNAGDNVASSTSENGTGLDISVDIRQVKIAACHTLRALARSLAQVRTNLAVTEIVDGIFELLSPPVPSSLETYEQIYGSDNLSPEDREQRIEDELEVKSAVMAAVCNLVLDFSPLQTLMLDKGILDIIVEGARSAYPPLRLNSVWALKHVVFGDGDELKFTVIRKVTYPYIFELCNDPEPQIQEQALDFVRNLVCRSADIVDDLLTQVGADRFFNLLEQKISADGIYERYPQIVKAAIYTLVHLAAGPDRHPDLIVQRESILKKLTPLMQHENADVRCACVWLVINLTWVEEHENYQRNESCKLRARKLLGLGFKEKLDETSRDPVLDVRERTKTALFQIEGLVGDTSQLPVDSLIPDRS